MALRSWDTKQVSASSMPGASVLVKSEHWFCHSGFVFFACFLSQRKDCLSNEQLILHELMIFQEGKEEKLYRFWFNPIYNISCVKESLSLVLSVFFFRQPTLSLWALWEYIYLIRKYLFPIKLVSYGKGILTIY